MSSQQLLMVKPGAGPPVVLNSEASPSLRPKVVSFNKSNCQAGLALKEEPDLFRWKPEWLPGFCTKLNAWRQVTRQLGVHPLLGGRLPSQARTWGPDTTGAVREALGSLMGLRNCA